MVNLVEAQKPLLHFLMKMAGVRPTTIEVEPGTTMHFWVPKETLNKKFTEGHTPKKTLKPNVVLVHGFAAEGVVTWQFQVGPLAKKYSVYVPDLIFFGNSTTERRDRSPTFQAECLVKALRKLGLERFTLVGFSYGGMVAFKVAELYPDMVEALVVSGSILAMTESISEAELTRMGFNTSSELLLPNSVKGLKELLRIATYKNLWFPDCLYKDYLEVMFTNRQERSELLDALVISNKNITIPTFPQRIHLLWGENDQIFRVELAENLREQLGAKATFESIKKAGHLAHLERPCVYTRCLKTFLSSLHSDVPKEHKA